MGTDVLIILLSINRLGHQKSNCSICTGNGSYCSTYSCRVYRNILARFTQQKQRPVVEKTASHIEILLLLQFLLTRHKASVDCTIVHPRSKIVVWRKKNIGILIRLGSLSTSISFKQKEKRKFNVFDTFPIQCLHFSHFITVPHCYVYIQFQCHQ